MYKLLPQIDNYIKYIRPPLLCLLYYLHFYPVLGLQLPIAFYLTLQYQLLPLY
jgi:hypothetical protein